MSHSSPDARTLSIEEFERLPENDEYRLELVRGHVVREPLPGPDHGQVVVNVAYYLRGWVARTGAGTVFAESGFALPGLPATVRGPDISFVAAGRVLRGRTFPELAPDLAVEVLSPSNSAAELRQKVNDYLTAGCRLVWVLDPRTRTATEYRPDGEPQRSSDEGMLDGGDVLRGFSVAVSELFP
jgi:Uma2 family endonuclease